MRLKEMLTVRRENFIWRVIVFRILMKAIQGNSFSYIAFISKLDCRRTFLRLIQEIMESVVKREAVLSF